MSVIDEFLANNEAYAGQSLARIHGSLFIPHKDEVRGFVYEVESGKLREVT